MRIVWFIVLATSFAAAEGAWAVPAPLRARQLMEAGLVHEKLGQHGLALKDFGQAIATRGLPHADLVRATFDQGVALDALGRTKEAIARYSAAIGLQSDFAPALNNRGNAFRRLGRIEQAKRDYFAALKSPGAAREFPYYGLAVIAQGAGDAEAARDYYLKALAVNPAFALAAQGLGSLHAPAPASSAARSSRIHNLTAQSVDIPTSERPKATPPLEAGVSLRRAIVDRPSARAAAGGEVQLGAYRDEAQARQAWDKYLETDSSLLQGHSPVIAPVDLPGKGRFWRLRTSVPDLPSAKSLCSALVQRGHACFVVRA